MRARDVNAQRLMRQGILLAGFEHVIVRIAVRLAVRLAVRD